MKKVRIAGLSVFLSATALLAYMYELAHETRLLTHTLTIKPKSSNILRIMEEAGATVLVDSSADIPNHPGWGICGLQDRTNGQVDIIKAVNSAQGYERLILAAHNPSLFRKTEVLLQPELSVAGHTHGGQIRFGSWGIQDLGSFEKNENTAKLISNGYGTTKLPLRLGAKPECHIIEIHY